MKKAFLMFGVVAMIAAGTQAAVVVGNSAATTVNKAADAALSVDAGSGAGRMLLVGFADETWSPVTYNSVKYAGADMNLLGHFALGEDSHYIRAYYLADPAEGSNTVDVSFGTTASTAMIAVVLSGASDAEPTYLTHADVDNAATETSVTHPSVSAGSCVVSFTLQGDNDTVWTPGAGMTNVLEVDAVSGDSALGTVLVTDAGPVTTSWEVSSTGPYRIGQMSIVVEQVPEPATMSLLGLGGLVALRRRRR